MKHVDLIKNAAQLLMAQSDQIVCNLTMPVRLEQSSAQDGVPTFGFGDEKQFAIDDRADYGFVGAAGGNGACRCW